MKKWKSGKPAAVMCLLLLCTSFACSVWAQDGESAPQISAGAAIAADLDGGGILYEKNADEAFSPANLSKIMTVLLLTENYDLNQTVSFSEILYETDEDGTRLGLQPGEEITLYDAACAIWLGNADDVVNGIAEYAAGSREAFTEEMNRRAQELGCQNTYFANPNGYYSKKQYTCASDLNRILQAAYQNAAFREISGLQEYEISATNLTQTSRCLQTSQQMLLPDSGSWQEFCVGGMESAAAHGTEHLVAFCSSGGRNLALVVLGASDAQTAADEAAQLAEYAFLQDTSSGDAQSTAQTEADGLDTGELLVLTEEDTAGQTGETASSAQENEAEQSGRGDRETQNTGNDLTDTVMSFLSPVLEKGNAMISALLGYAGEHKMLTVAVVDGLLAVILLVLLVISFVRSVRNAKIRRRRKREKRQRRLREARIEQMSVEELENGLNRERKKDNQDSNKRND